MPQHLRMCLFGVDVDHKYVLLCLALALWGVGQGAGPVVEALLADSTPTGVYICSSCMSCCNGMWLVDILYSILCNSQCRLEFIGHAAEIVRIKKH